MTDKPTTAAGYDSEYTKLVRATCLYVATRLGDLLDDLVVIGGLVPSLLIEQDDLRDGADAHVGTMDLDMGITIALLGDGGRGNSHPEAGFPEHDGVGPRRVAEFLARAPNDEIQADVVGFLGLLLDLCA